MTAPPPTRPDLKRYRSSTVLTMRATPNELPAGVCGQVEGIAMIYGVIDSWGTTFAKGCLDRTVRERVAARKVKLYFDHGDVVLSGMYDTHLHIGTVVDVWDDTTEDGLACSRFRADIFDTAPGRTAHEYLTAVAQTRSETGVSIGMMDEPKTVRAVVAGLQCDQVTEAALREISITGEPSVPGTKVTWVRQESMKSPDMSVATMECPAPQFAAGDVVRATADHEPGMAGMVGRIATVRCGPYYAIDFGAAAESDDPSPHKWLAEDELEDAKGATVEPHRAYHIGAPPNYFALLDGLVAHLGLPAVRAHLGTTVSNARSEHSDAASGAPDSADSLGSSHADSPGVSRGGTEPPAPNVVPITERVAWARSTYTRL